MKRRSSLAATLRMFLALGLFGLFGVLGFAEATAKAAGPAKPRLVAKIATAFAEYPAIVTGVVPITDSLLHPEHDLAGRTYDEPKHWITEEGFHVDREPCTWDGSGQAVAYRVAFPVTADRRRSAPERRIEIREAERPGRAHLEAWRTATTPAGVRLALELSGGGRFQTDLFTAPLPSSKATWIRHRRSWQRLERVVANELFGLQPPILGVHGYQQVRADGISIVELRVSNAAVHPDGSGAQGTVFLDSIHVEFPEGWNLVWDETCGSQIDKGGKATLVAPGTGPFAFDTRRQTIRRFALCRPGSERRAGRVLRGEGFGRSEGPNSYHEGGWGNRSDRIPNYDRPPLRSAFHVGETRGWRAVEVHGDRAVGRLVDRLAQGSPGRRGRTREFGLFHPAGSSDRGEQGGWLIESSPGAGLAARNWMRHARLLAYLMAERTPAAFDPETGMPLTAEEIAQAHDGVFPYEIHLTGAWWYDKHELPWWRELESIGDSVDLPTLKGLRGFAPIDAEHYVRAYTSAYAWALLTGDPLAADLVREAAARVETAWTLCPTTPGDTQGKPSQWWADLTLGARLREATARPGQGVYSTRDLAWAIECMVAAYRLTPPAESARRAELARWLEAAAQYIVLIQTPSGVCEARRAVNRDGTWQSTYSPDPFRNGVSHDWLVAQWLEESLRVNACGSLVKHITNAELRKAVADNMRRTVGTMLAGMRELRRTTPPKWVGTKPGSTDVLHPNYGGESFQSQSALWVVGVDPAVIHRMHGDGSARAYVLEICRKVTETAPDLLAHVVPILADIVNDER